MFKLKKIASALASALMLGSTVGFAAATTYPAPFVTGGVADTAIVFGSHPAATADLAGATRIMANLNTFVTSTGGTTTPTGGDVVQLEKTSTKFHLGNGILDVVSSSITDDDLEVLLKDGTYTDDDNDDFDYTQKLTLANLSLTMFDDNDYKEDTPTVGFSISSNTHIMNYTLDFNTDPLWADLPQTDIEIMGKDYFILSVTTNTTLNLLDSGVTRSVDEGETVTVTAGDQTYEVSAQIYSATNARLTINGERTNSLNVGETQKLSGSDTYIGIKSIDYISKDVGVSAVEFAIGSGKIELIDGQDMQINDDSISGLAVDLINSAEKLQKVVISWAAEDDMFVADDSSITMPGFENIKMSFTGITYPAEETFTVQGGSTTYVQLNDFPLKDSTEDINLLYGASGQFTGVGKEAGHLLRTTNESSLTFDGDTDDYFVASYDDGSNAESYLVQATSFGLVSGSTTDNKTTIQYKKDGIWTDRKENAIVGDVVSLGNVQLTIGAIDRTAKTVVITAGSGTNFNRLYSKEGLKIWLPWSYNSANYTLTGSGGRGVWQSNGSAQGYSTTAGNVSWQLQFEEEDKNENIGSGNDFNMTLAWNSDSEAHVSDLVGESVAAAEVGDTNIFRTFIYSALATEFMWDQGSGTSEQDSIDVIYHGAESSANAFLTAAGAVIGGGEGTVPVPVLDTATSTFAGKNIVVVGGSCVNTIAAELLGSSTPLCGAEWTAKTGLGAGSYLIESFNRAGKIATLVAGWEMSDTDTAATALTTPSYAIDTTAGKKYTGSVTSSLVPTLVSA